MILKCFMYACLLTVACLFTVQINRLTAHISSTSTFQPAPRQPAPRQPAPRKQPFNHRIFPRQPFPRQFV